MITLNLDWREVLWWMQGGMAGSHLRWSVYEDMVNRVWPQCSEQERRNIHYIMERDFGTYWRNSDGSWKSESDIFDKTPFEYFRQVLARFDPENQYAVTMAVHNAEELDSVIFFTPAASVISRPSIPHTVEEYDAWHSDTATVTVRAYKWQEEYYIDWSRRCDEYLKPAITVHKALPVERIKAELLARKEKYTRRGEESDAMPDGKGMYWGGVLSALNEVLTVIEQIEKED